MRQGPHQVAVKSTTTVLPALAASAWSHSALECTTITCGGASGGGEGMAVEGACKGRPGGEAGRQAAAGRAGDERRGGTCRVSTGRRGRRSSTVLAGHARDWARPGTGPRRRARQRSPALDRSGRGGAAPIGASAGAAIQQSAALPEALPAPPYRTNLAAGHRCKLRSLLGDREARECALGRAGASPTFGGALLALTWRCRGAGGCPFRLLDGLRDCNIPLLYRPANLALGVAMVAEQRAEEP